MIIENNKIALDQPTYFIADIAANHDGDISRAKDLIYQAAEAGADAAKFQHFNAKTIVSKEGFEKFQDQKSHQSKWGKSVFEVYRNAEVNLSWTPILKETCKKAGISFFTSPYSIELVDEVDPFVPAYKIGSGDITWIEIIKHIASKNKPYILATGASTIEDVSRAVNAALNVNENLALLQCNTNYTASLENFKFIQLNVLKKYAELFPNLILGLSDHTKNHVSTLGAIALGAKVIEKHFTDDDTRQGPDHSFALTPGQWVEMMDRSRELEASLGLPEKNIEDNELESVVVQRRSICAAKNLKKGTVISEEHITMLRPCSKFGLEPYRLSEVLGKKLMRNIALGENINFAALKSTHEN